MTSAPDTVNAAAGPDPSSRVLGEFAQRAGASIVNALLDAAGTATALAECEGALRDARRQVQSLAEALAEREQALTEAQALVDGLTADLDAERSKARRRQRRSEKAATNGAEAKTEPPAPVEPEPLDGGEGGLHLGEERGIPDPYAEHDEEPVPA